MEIVSNWAFVVVKQAKRAGLPLIGGLQCPDGSVVMNRYSIHKNLNTSFVDLSALVRHLHGLQFVGSIHVELSSYDAEIRFGEDGSVKAREHDHIAGRIAFGVDALTRVIVRSTEPGGTIHVYKEQAASDVPVFIDGAIRSQAHRMADDGPTLKNVPALFPGRLAEFQNLQMPAEAELPSLDNWSELLGLISELMQTIDDAMAKGNFNFVDAFRNACGFVSYDHPFLDPDTDVFSYSDGYISIRQRMSSKDVITGIIAALERIMHRLREDPYFGTLYHQTMHRMRVLANRRKLQFDSFGLGIQLQKITGI